MTVVVQSLDVDRSDCEPKGWGSSTLAEIVEEFSVFLEARIQPGQLGCVYIRIERYTPGFRHIPGLSARLRLNPCGKSVQAENCEDCSVDAPLFLGAEMACDVSETTDVDGAHLFDQDFGLGALHFDFGSKGRWSCASGRRRNQDNGAGEKCIRLDDHAVALPVLFVPDALGESKIENVTPSHAGSP